jgi:hypothetical protein
MGMRDWNVAQMEKMKGKGGEEGLEERWLYDLEVQKNSGVSPEDVAGGFRQFIRSQIGAVHRCFHGPQGEPGRPVKIVGVGESFELDAMLVSMMRGDFTDSALSEIGGQIAQIGRVDIEVGGHGAEENDGRVRRRDARISYRRQGESYWRRQTDEEVAALGPDNRQPENRGLRRRREWIEEPTGAEARTFNIFADIYDRNYDMFDEMDRRRMRLIDSPAESDNGDEDDEPDASTPPARPAGGRGGGARRDRDNDQGGGRRGR